MPPSIRQLKLRPLGPGGLAEMEWLQVPGEGMVQTAESRWVGYLSAEYSVDLADDGRDPRDCLAPVLVRPDGSEIAGFSFGFPLRPTVASLRQGGPPIDVGLEQNHSNRIELDLPEPGDYRIELREGRLSGPEGAQPTPGAPALAVTTFRRV